MSSYSDIFQKASELANVAAWLSVVLILRPRGHDRSSPQRHRDRRSWFGLTLQGLAFAALWSFRRPRSAESPTLSLALDIAGVVVLALSVGLAYRSASALGKHWSITARVVESHALVTTGPYRVVRHPIYVAMLGMLVATGLTFTRWSVLLAALAMYLLGTAIRVRSEDALLRQYFGQSFVEYSVRVPAIFPHVWPGARNRGSGR